MPVEMGIQREVRYFCLCFSNRCCAANLPFVDLAVLPAGVSAPRWTRVMRLSVLKAMLGA